MLLIISDNVASLLLFFDDQYKLAIIKEDMTKTCEISRAHHILILVVF